MAPSFEQEIGSTLGTVPEVEGVYVFPNGNCKGFRVITVVDREEDPVYRLIYGQELELAHRLTGAELEFEVIARRGRTREQVMGWDHPAWERAAVDGRSR